MSGQAIYESFTRSDLGILDESARQALRILTNYASRAVDLNRLSTTMEHAWQGTAAGAARRGAAPVEIGHITAMPQLNNVAFSMNQQYVAFQAAKNSVVPVPPVPEKPGFFDNLFSLGGASDDYERRIRAVQSANDNNIAVMTQYENATLRNKAVLTGVPEALPPILPDGDGTVDDSLHDRDVASGDRTTSPGGASPSASGTGPAASGTGPSPAAAGSGTTSGPRLPSESSVTGADALRTRPESALTTASGLTPTDSGTPRPTPEGPRPGVPQASLGVGYTPGADPTGEGARGSGGGRGTSGGARVAGEPAARGGAVGTRGPAGVDGTVGRGAAGRAGAPGTSGPIGGRRGKDEDDLEHERPAFLVEADPDELFGNDEAAAPPVIGG